MINIELVAGVQNAHQRFTQRVDGRLLSFEIDYISYTKSPYWSMNVLQDGFPIAQGIPLNVGGDLLANQNVQNFGQLVFVGEEATLNNLGIANKLVWVPTA